LKKEHEYIGPVKPSGKKNQAGGIETKKSEWTRVENTVSTGELGGRQEGRWKHSEKGELEKKQRFVGPTQSTVRGEKGRFTETEGKLPKKKRDAGVAG